MKKLRPCRGPHPLLIIEEPNALGAVCFCLQCRNTQQIPAEMIDSRYYHAQHISGQGEQFDRDFLIFADLVPGLSLS